MKKFVSVLSMNVKKVRYGLLDEYQIKMDKIIKLHKNKPVVECLNALLKEASKWVVVKNNVIRRKHKKTQKRPKEGV